MSSIVYEGRTLPIPEAFAKFIIEHSLSNLGVYKGREHVFADPFLNPRYQTDWDAIYDIGESDFQFDQDACNLMIAQVCKERNNASPRRSLVESVASSGDNALKSLQLLELEEENGSVTKLVYVGDQRFFVLSTSRSTLAFGDILESVSMPLSRGEAELFNLYRNAELYKPKEAEVADVCYFKTGVLRSITLIDSPALLKIIDQEPSLGGTLRVVDSHAEEFLTGFVRFVASIVERLGPLPEREEFPEYLSILEVAKDSGICTLLCNEIISAVERREKFVDAYNEEDWDLRISDAKRAEIDANTINQSYKIYSDCEKTLEGICRQVRARRFLLFFKKSGRFNDADRERATALSLQMDENAKKIQEAQKDLGEILAKTNWKTKKLVSAMECQVEPAYGRSMIQDALDKSKVPPTFNLKQGAKVFSALAAIIIVVVLVRMSSDSIDRFNKEADSIAPLLEQAEFDQAKQKVDAAREDFRPGFLRFLVNSQYRSAHQAIEKAIDDEVDNGIEQINTLLRATHGRFTDEMVDYLSQLLRWRPEDSRLMELRERYLNH